MRDVIRGLGHHGVRKIVVLNGHFENSWPAVEGLDLGLRELRRDGITDMQAMRLEYWDFVKRATLDKLFPEGFPGTELEHASLLETSLMLVLRPDLVDMSKVPDDGPAKFPNYDRHPVPKDFVPASGVLARAGKATAEKGEMADRRPCRADHRRRPKGVRTDADREMSIDDFEPLDSGKVPRFAGPSTFMRLPVARTEAGRHRAGRRALRRRHHQPRRRAARSARDPQPVEPDPPRPSCQRHLAVRPCAHRRLRRLPVNPIDLMEALDKITQLLGRRAPRRRPSRWRRAAIT